MASPDPGQLHAAGPSPRAADTGRTFRAFEQAGWEDPGVVASYEEHLSAVTTQSIEALLDDAGVGAGTRVLDVASGAGHTAAAAARRGADALGLDFSEAQVQLARGRHPDVPFERGDAEALPFEAGTFDAVVSGFGMCHLPDPGRALAEAFRVLRPGGRVAFTVWAPPERAIVFGALYAAIRAHGTMDVGLPVGPNFFLFSEPAVCTQALRAAGFTGPSFREVPQGWRLSDPDELFEVIARGTVRARATLRAQTPAARSAIRHAMREVVSAYPVGDLYEVPAPAVLAAARKP